MNASENPADELPHLTGEQANALARLVLAGIEREFPHKPGHVMAGPADVLPPRRRHPVFFGCFDWHSAVHGHWTLVRLLRLFPDLRSAAEIRSLLARQLTPEKLAAEAALFRRAENRSFERMYGWAWLLRLAAELHSWNDGDAQVWAAALRPLESVIVELASAYLPKLRSPIRSGVHSDTAFALGQMFDYARALGDGEFAALLAGRAAAYYAQDRDYPSHYEPSGEDFFSPAWNEADLMRRVLGEESFCIWLDAFLPALSEGDAAGRLGELLTPVDVTDVTDGRLVHLAGLNLSRAWAQRGVAASLPAGDPRRAVLARSIAAHTSAGMQHVHSGHYEGEHWLATFAVYLLTGVGNA